MCLSCYNVSMDYKKLEIIYRHAELSEDLDLGIKLHGISKSTLLEVANVHGWEPGDGVLQWMSESSGDTLPSEDHVKATHIATSRKLHGLLEKSLREISLLNLKGVALLKLVSGAVRVHSDLLKNDSLLYDIKTASNNDDTEFGFDITVRPK